jgi:heptosyltransferase-2
MKNLVIKVKALGDVLRTTPIFRVLKGENYLLSDKKVKEFIPEKNRFIKKIITLDDKESLLKINFNLVLNLEEDENLAKFVSDLKYKKLVGVYLNKNEKLSYTFNSRKWFDMGLISHYGLQKANELKYQNKTSYQEILFEMIGKKFQGEEYIIKKPKNNFNKKVVIIEKRAGKVWPMKKWPFYNFLAKKIKLLGYRVVFLKQRKNIFDYINDINRGKILICGDTFAMHIGLALKKKIICLFICTSPAEIYDYQRMIKIINPFLKQAFYRRDYNKKLVSGIKLKEVFDKFLMFA